MIVSTETLTTQKIEFLFNFFQTNHFVLFSFCIYTAPPAPRGAKKGPPAAPMAAKKGPPAAPRGAKKGPPAAPLGAKKRTLSLFYL